MEQSPRDLQSLLAWSTANTREQLETADTPSAPAPARQPAGRIDPGILDAILGKTDAVRMRECVATASDMSKSLDARMTAWDELEMILESLDNPLGLWPQIVSHLTSTEDETVVQALWVCGTAINNNPKARDDFLRQDPLPTLVSLPRSSSQAQEVRSKALYCLGGVLKHNTLALERFTELGGWLALQESLEDPSLSCRRKAAFLLGSLLADEATEEIARRGIAANRPIISHLVAPLTPASALPSGVNGDGPGFDEDVAENALRVISLLGPQHMTPDEREATVKALVDADSETPFGLARQEKEDLLSRLKA